MSTPTVSAAPRPAIPAEVAAFAREQGVQQYLPELIEWARHVYPSATRFEVFVEDDAETEDRCIVFELDAPLSAEQALEADKLWREGFFRIYKYPRTCMICKSVYLP
jgi:hypothetical protein